MDQTERLLLCYPYLSAQMHNWRQNLYHGYRQGATAGGRYSQGRHGDSTGGKAAKLAMIEHQLRPRDRPLLLSKWRRQSWQQIARREQVEVWMVKEQWQFMIERLRLYLRRYAGTACGQDGGVCVSGRKIEQGVILS